mgnify:CR=1 FL=1
MLAIKQYIETVNKAIEEIEYPATPAGLYQPIKYALEAGGKRMRPVLLLASCNAFGGDLEHAIWPAVGIEIFHNFTLVHDDVMDHADVRRGRPTVHKKWNTNTAILSGDAMVTMAYKCMAGCQPMYLPEVIDKFGMMTMNVYEGQQIDEDFEKLTEVSFDEYLKMIMGKTSALIAYPLAIGAVLSGAQQADVEAMFNFGVSLGIAFQMQDDYLDVYGDPATFGKAIGGDILNDKKTWLHIIAKDKAKEQIEALSALEGDEKIMAVTALYDSLSLRIQGQKLIEKYTQDAIEYLNATTMPQDAKDWFVSFSNSLIGRKK